MKQLNDYSIKELIEEYVGIQITNELEEKLMTSELAIKVLAKRIINHCIYGDAISKSDLRTDVFDIVHKYDDSPLTNEEIDFNEQLYRELGSTYYKKFIIVYQELVDMVEITVNFKTVEIEKGIVIYDLINALNKVVVLLIDSTKDNNVSNCKLEKLVMSIVSLSMSLLIQRKKQEIEITIKLSTIKDIIQLLNDVDKEMITDYEKETIMKFLSYFNS